MKQYDTIGVIGRFKPFHSGAAAMLKSLCEQAEHVKIGIGSSHGEGIAAKYNARNPFTPEETEEMISIFLNEVPGSHSIHHIPDFAQIPEYSNGQKWRSYVTKQFGDLDRFVTGNPYVQSLLAPDYEIVHPADMIPREHWVPVKGTLVRIAMAQGDAWKNMVPPQVASYITKHRLDSRFREEFGLETLCHLTNSVNCTLTENITNEQQHTRGN